MCDTLTSGCLVSNKLSSVYLTNTYSVLCVLCEALPLYLPPSLCLFSPAYLVSAEEEVQDLAHARQIFSHNFYFHLNPVFLTLEIREVENMSYVTLE